MKHKGESLTLVSARCAVVLLISGILAEMKMRKEQYLEIDRKKGFPSSFLLSCLPSFLHMETRESRQKVWAEDEVQY